MQFQRFRFDQPTIGNIIDDEMREVGLARHRTNRRELGRGEARDVIDVRMRIGNALQGRRVRLVRNARGAPEMGEIGMGFDGWAHGRAYNAKTAMLPSSLSDLDQLNVFGKDRRRLVM